MSIIRKAYKLEDICTNITDGAHASPKEDIEGNRRIATVKDMTDFGINLDQCKRISELDFEVLKSTGCMPKKGDVLFSKDGTIGKVLFYNSTNEIGVLSSIAIFRPNQNVVDGKYLSLYLRDKTINQYISDNYRSGSAIPRIILRDFRKFELAIPSLSEQRAIATLLSALDDKIELNLQMNRTLEEMAMSLYKHWFVDFGPFRDGEFVTSELGEIPKGWEVKRLDQISHKKSETFNFSKHSEVVFVNTGDVLEGRFLHSDSISKEGLPGQAKKSISKGDILYSEIRPKNKRYAFVNFEASNYVVSTKFMVINPKSNILGKLLYRILTLQSSVDNFDSIAEGRSGTFPQITFDAISEMQIVLSPLQVQNQFQEIVGPMELLQDELFFENQTLTTLRDALLPKLISGEVRVKEAAKSLAEVL